MQMNVSGSATGTGKSFWQSVWMAVFEGEVKTTLNGITEAQAYQRLASGENIYGNYNVYALLGVNREEDICWTLFLIFKSIAQNFTKNHLIFIRNLTPHA